MMIVACYISEDNRFRPLSPLISLDDMRQGSAALRIGLICNPEYAVVVKALRSHPDVVDHLLTAVYRKGLGLFHTPCPWIMQMAEYHPPSL